MSKIHMIKSVLNEYGKEWAFNRLLYSLKLGGMKAFPYIERVFEESPFYPGRTDLFLLDIQEIRSFLQGLNIEDKNELLDRADRACNGIIRGFSSIDLDYGNPIDWQLSPLTGKRCSEKDKWYRIPDFDMERGDIKAIWEASRFSHFITLVRAYLLSGDKKYYSAFSEQLNSWLENNPYGYGANFKCGQECSLRMVNTLLAFTVFKKAGVATDSDESNVIDLIDRCYRKVLSNFFYAYKCIKNNHTISELMGMIVGAWCCEDTKQVQKAFRMLDQVIEEQFTEDGGYKQFSFNYERLALQDLECILSIEDRTGFHLSEGSKKRIMNASILMYQCQDESCDMPNYGPNDGALIFPVTSCGYRDFRPVINTIYALTTGKQLFQSDKHQEELIWFSTRNINDYPIINLPRSSCRFDDAGLFTIRDVHSWVMVVLNDYKSRPAHLDQLHLDLWIDGKNIFCDAGTFSYASEIGRTLVKTQSHNTVKAADKEQMSLHGPFMIYNWTKREIKQADHNCFQGIVVSENGYKHQRSISYKDGVYEIIDDADSDYKVLFHTSCDVAVADNVLTLSDNGKVYCVLQSDGSVEIHDTIRSLFYLQQQKTKCITISAKKNKTVHTTIQVRGI